MESLNRWFIAVLLLAMCELLAKSLLIVAELVVMHCWPGVNNSDYASVKPIYRFENPYNSISARLRDKAIIICTRAIVTSQVGQDSTQPHFEATIMFLPIFTNSAARPADQLAATWPQLTELEIDVFI